LWELSTTRLRALSVSTRLWELSTAWLRALSVSSVMWELSTPRPSSSELWVLSTDLLLLLKGRFIDDYPCELFVLDSCGVIVSRAWRASSSSPIGFPNVAVGVGSAAVELAGSGSSELG